MLPEISSAADGLGNAPMMTGFAHLGHLVIYLLFIAADHQLTVMMLSRQYVLVLVLTMPRTQRKRL